MKGIRKARNTRVATLVLIGLLVLPGWSAKANVPDHPIFPGRSEQTDFSTWTPVISEPQSGVIHQLAQTQALSSTASMSLDPLPSFLQYISSTSAIDVSRRALEPIKLPAQRLPRQDRARRSSDFNRYPSRQTTASDGITALCTVATPADSGAGSLRQCLLDAAEGATINFEPQVFSSTMPVTITLSSSLPVITTDALTVDGSDAGVVLDGSELSIGSGLVISGANEVTIRGLQVLNFPSNGIELAGGTSNAVIGGDRSAGAVPLGQGNLLSGNGGYGVWLCGTGVTNNQVLGNYIGTDVTGSWPFGNAWAGVAISSGASQNIIGGDTSGAGNLISGNAGAGVQIQDNGTISNHVLGNYVGTDVTGLAPIENTWGIVISDGAEENVLGGDAEGARNLVSGNVETGIQIQNSGTVSNRILGNYVGTDATGLAPLGNADGIGIIDGAKNNIVGGATEGARNIVSGNANRGVVIQNEETSGNQILGNYVGMDATGAQPLGNGFAGVLVFLGANQNTIGGDGPGAGNLISGNGVVPCLFRADGVVISGQGTSYNQVLGNYIGTDATGTLAIGKTLSGVTIILAASHNIIGGDTSGAGNLISRND